MQKQRLRDLWKCQHSPAKKPSKRPSDRAVRSAYQKELQQLENQKLHLDNELEKLSGEYYYNREAEIAVRVANTVIEIDGIKRKMARFQARRRK